MTFRSTWTQVAQMVSACCRWYHIRGQYRIRRPQYRNQKSRSLDRANWGIDRFLKQFYKPNMRWGNCFEIITEDLGTLCVDIQRDIIMKPRRSGQGLAPKPAHLPSPPDSGAVKESGRNMELFCLLQERAFSREHMARSKYHNQS